ncbi:MAG: hypothetical protein WC612_07655, partial [Bdellovibrionales bacterium]
SLEKQGQNTSRIEEGSAEKNDQLFALKIVNLPTPFDHYAEITIILRQLKNPKTFWPRLPVAF